MRLKGYCCDGRRAKGKEWAYQEARKTDSRMEEGSTRPIREAQNWVREGIISIGFKRREICCWTHIIYCKNNSLFRYRGELQVSNENHSHVPMIFR